MRTKHLQVAIFILLIGNTITVVFGNANLADPVEISFDDASVQFKDDQLSVCTGRISRTWEWTGFGFLTVSLKDLESDHEWCSDNSLYQCDWSFPGLIDQDTKARLISLTADVKNDEQFTSKHIEVIAEIHYQSGIAVQFSVWVYPEVSGVRTQLKVKSLHGMNRTKARNLPARNEYIPLDWRGVDRRAIGYYNNTQRRNAANLELLREEVVTGSVVRPEKYDWPSILIAEDAEGGLILVKESHKCVNQAGLATGSFHADRAGFSSTGWGLHANDILADRWRPAWGHWCILYNGSEQFSRELALKEFDRKRFPVNPDLDIYILANTWGSGNQSAAAREENVMVEIETQAELGIDVQQIDEGWQNPDHMPWVASTLWVPHSDKYPTGWKNVVEKAEVNDVKLGIWFSVGNLNEHFRELYGDNWYADLEDFKRVFDEGHFTYYKFDMANLTTYDEMESLIKQSRDFIKYANHNIRINWDVTENEARTGYFFGRDLGNVFLANRTTPQGRPTVYVPSLVLRDAWQVSKYINLNKFQISIQNIRMTDKESSNAYLYNHPYSVAIALMGSPLFFQETHYYSDQARKEISALLEIYKKQREEMYKGYVFPVGMIPDDTNWTGFQNHNPATNSGYLLIFRELNNQLNHEKIQLYFTRGKKVNLTDLMTGKSFSEQADSQGGLEFEIKKPADFLFLKYNID